MGDSRTLLRTCRMLCHRTSQNTQPVKQNNELNYITLINKITAMRYTSICKLIVSNRVRDFMQSLSLKTLNLAFKNMKKKKKKIM